MLDRATVLQRQSLPMEAKVGLTFARIRDWIDHWQGSVYVSFSGGKDSTVLLDIARQVRSSIPAVFIDTGLEFPEIRDFVKTVPNVTWIRPKLTFKEVIDQYGYPCVSKEQAQFIREYRETKSDKLRDIRIVGNSYGQGKIFHKWLPLLDAPFRISEKCCDVMKKRPAYKYERETGNHPIIGTMFGESITRNTNYYRYGCNAFDAKRPTSRPMSFWKESDVWEYIKSRNLRYSPIYDMGYERTGCMFCMFGAHLESEPNRFQRMAQTHPAQHKYCMEKLGLAQCLDYLSIQKGTPDA